MNSSIPAKQDQRVHHPILATAVKSVDDKKLSSAWFQKVISTPWIFWSTMTGGVLVYVFCFAMFLTVCGLMFSGSNSLHNSGGNGGYSEWENGGFSDGRGGFHSRSGLSHGTFDQTRRGNDVISVDGEVLNLPPY